MAQARSNCNSAQGFSLVEVVVAMAILTVVSLGVAQLFAASTRINIIARGQTSTTMLAEQKIEQIRSLTWGFDSSGEGLPVSDTTSNLTIYPTDQSGTGMNPTPANALEENTTGCVDFVDANGTWVGTGSTPPATAVYIRRWSIQPLPTNPNNTLIIQVLVTPIANEAARKTTGNARLRMPGDTLLMTVKTRKSA
jgi:prepilin-type N-terminal cleavage/methylation domain-containing protein